ncbi:rhomboid-like protein [Dactylosporangium sp. NPDC005572]|uniref:rhomboid-like protein n=1 Tax=Dactylosporangium sp. NPDC005572 TaxID=3156889 RepID=UPI0033B83BE0
MIRRKRLHEDRPGLVSASYLPGGDLADALAAAPRWPDRARVLLGAVAGLRLAPLYVLSIVVIGVVLDSVADPHTRDRVVAANSTNVANLEQHRFWTLLTSAFVLGNGVQPTAVASLLLLTSVAELLWGRRRLIEVFFLTHVIASCLVFAVLQAGLRYDWLQRAIANVSDVGTSYGAHAVGGALAFSFPARARRVLIPLELVFVGLPLLLGRTFTDLGHLLATLIGLLAGWQMRHRPLAGRLRLPRVLRADRATVFAFDTEAEARSGLVAVLHLQEHRQLRLADAVVAWSDRSPERAYRIHERETRDLGVLDGALVGAAWGVVLGTVAAVPLTGLVVGAVLVAAVAGLHDAGLSDTVVVRSVRAVPPGHAVLVLLTDPTDPAGLPRCTAVLAGAGGTPVEVPGR